MADEFGSENSVPGTSPRISFSYDLSQSDTAPIEQTLFRSNSKTNTDFDFCIGNSFENNSSSADVLFSEGKLIPTQIKKNIANQKQSNFPDPPKLLQKTPKFEINRNENDEGLKEKNNTKSFWGFKRSNSCGSGYGPSFCPLPLLSRSNSTGSANNKKSSGFRENQNNQKQNLLKNSSNVSSRSSNLKPPLKKNYGSYGNGINPILNVNSGNLFGLGSIFSNGKDKNKKK